jgi:hypothetical protein
MLGSISTEDIPSEVSIQARYSLFRCRRKDLIDGLCYRFKVEKQYAENAIERAKDAGIIKEINEYVQLVV